MSRSTYLNLLWLALCVPIVCSADEIFRTVDESGQVIYSDTPPLDNARQVEIIDLPPAPSRASVKAAESRNKAILERLNEVDKQRDKELRQQKRRIKQAQESLAQAEAHLADTKVLKDEDRQSLAGGKRRIRPEYFERVRQAEAEVEAARKRLQKAQNSR